MARRVRRSPRRAPPPARPVGEILTSQELAVRLKIEPRECRRLFQGACFYLGKKLQRFDWNRVLQLLEEYRHGGAA